MLIGYLLVRSHHDHTNVWPNCVELFAWWQGGRCYVVQWFAQSAIANTVSSQARSRKASKCERQPLEESQLPRSHRHGRHQVSWHNGGRLLPHAGHDDLDCLAVCPAPTRIRPIPIYV